MFEKNDGAAQERLLTAEAYDNEHVGAPSGPTRRSLSKHNCVLIAILSISVAINVGLSLAYSASKSQNPVSVNGVGQPRPTLYSPDQNAIEYKLSRFQSSIYDGKTEYQGHPTKTNNRLWADLYRNMLTHISPDAARLLPNKTAPEQASQGSGYVVVLNVFHDLHCLDNLRKGFYYFLEDQWNSTHNPYVLYDKVEDGLQARGDDHLGAEHLDHCIDSLRQSIQCSADVVPNVFQYDTQTKDIRARSTVVHECRDFGKIQEWSAQHHIEGTIQDFGDGPELGKCVVDDPWTCLGQQQLK